MRASRYVPPQMLAFAQAALEDRPNPYVVVITVGGLFDAETGESEAEGGLRFFAAAHEYFENFTDDVKDIYAQHFADEYGRTLKPDAKGRHAIDALFDDNDFPDDAVFVVFAGSSEWASGLEAVTRIAKRAGPSRRLMMISCTCGHEAKQTLAQMTLPAPPLEHMLFTSECSGAETVYAVMLALAIHHAEQ